MPVRALILIVLCAVCATAPGADLVPATTDATNGAAKDILAAHCFSCHGSQRTKGGVNFETLVTRTLNGANLKIWRKASSLVKQEEMPSEETEHPLNAADRAKLIAWLDQLRYDGPPDPGRVTLRRLNRREYGNTIKDLLGVEIPVADMLPRDDIGDGFDTSADVLALPPALFDKYADAARLAVESAIEVGQVATIVIPDQVTVTVMVAGAPLKAPIAEGVLTLDQGGECQVSLYAPTAGRYRIKADLGGIQGGKEPVRVQVLIDGQAEKDQNVTAPKPRTSSLGSIELSQGMHRLSLIFINPETVETPKGTIKRSLLLGDITMEGPPARRPGTAHQALIGDGPGRDGDPRATARVVLANFLPRAWRRPVSAEEIDRLLAIFDQALALGETWAGALRHPLQAALLSPNFLYRVEHDKPADGITTLSNFEIASRLSYFLWSSMPDAALFTAATAGELTKPAGRAAQVRRMLKDSRSRALVDGFASQWLTLGNLETFQPDPAQYRGFDDRLRESMLMEPLEYFATMLAEDRDLTELIVSDWTILDPRLAAHYGLSLTGSIRQKVTLTGKDRGGVLTMAAILTVTSNPDHTSPSRRGKFVLEQILNDPPPPPPPTAGGLPKPDAGHPTTARERLEQHRNRAECVSCHKRLDPLGFAFEGFDVIGRTRDRDEGRPVDTSGVLPGGQKIRGPEDLKKILVTTHKTDFLRCFTGKMMTYAIGRGVDYRDEDRIDAIVADLEKNGQRMTALLLAVVESPQFLQRSARNP